MALLTYTTYAEVRSVLGVSATDINDTVLAQPQWSTLLDEALIDVSASVSTLYATIAGTAEGSRTANQQRFYNMARLYASVAVAKELLTSLPMFSVQRLADGKAEFDRFADAYKDVREYVLGLFKSLKIKLAAMTLVLEPTAIVYSAATLTMVVGVPLGTDPVTTTEA
jgi:hypothetical protein